MDDNLFDGIFDLPKLRTPKDILDDFGVKIENESKLVLTAEIRTIQTSSQNILAYGYAVKSNYTSYSYNIFSVFYDILLYPCIISAEQALIEGAGLATLHTLHQLNGFPINGIKVGTEEELKSYIMNRPGNLGGFRL